MFSFVTRDLSVSLCSELGKGTCAAYSDNFDLLTYRLITSPLQELTCHSITRCLHFVAGTTGCKVYTDLNETSLYV